MKSIVFLATLLALFSASSAACNECLCPATPQNTDITYNATDPVWEVVYVEVEFADVQAAIALFQAFAQAAAADANVVQFDVLEQKKPLANHFTLIVQLGSTDDYTCFLVQPYYKALLAGLTPLLASPNYVILHHTLQGSVHPTLQWSVHPTQASTTCQQLGNALWLLIPVDIQPAGAQSAVTILQGVAQSLAQDPLVLQYFILQQEPGSDNHFTFAVTLMNQASYEQYITEPYVKGFRMALGPIAGSPPDQRLTKKVAGTYFC